MNWTCCVLLTILVGFFCASASLFFDDNWQTCLCDGKTLKVVLCTKFCPLCDKQVIASALGQLRINFTSMFKVLQIALIALRLGQFCNFVKTLKILVKLILNCPRAHAITYTNHTSDNKIGRLWSGSPICLSWVWLQTELDDTKYYMYYQLIIKILEPRLKKGKNCIKRLSRRRKVLNVALKLGLVDLNTTVNVTGPFKPELWIWLAHCTVQKQTVQ